MPLSACRKLSILVWLLALVAIPVWNAVDPGNGWDAKPILNAIHSLAAGHDPYLDGMATRIDFQNHLALHPGAPIPFFYVYSPLTLPLLRAVSAFPAALYCGFYWLLYAVGAILPLWVCVKTAEANERQIVALVAPAALFFPGLLQHCAIMSGNTAYIFYGLIFAAALWGWRRSQWRWFYLAVLLASCFKLPFLSLLAIPPLSARKQWLPAGIAAAAGAALFAVQLWIWPDYFHHYLQALTLIFSLDHGFGFAPTGLLGRALFDAGMPYSTGGAIFHLLFALLLFASLLFLSRQHLRSRFSLEQWVPVLLTGVLLLNPRVQEYDVAPLTVFLAVIVWRSAASSLGNARALLFCALGFVVLNAGAIAVNTFDVENYYWNHGEGILLTAIFTAGVFRLVMLSRAPTEVFEEIEDEPLAAEAAF